ncbi:MAG: acetate--CoA ligase family protein [Syntrophales bacterium]
MQKLFYPESVAVFGVSGSSTNLARNIVQNLDRFGFKGQVFPFGHEGGHLDGRPIYRDIGEIRQIPDVAVLLIPARFIPGVVNACGQKGVHYVVIESAGFTEYSEANRDLEKDLLEAARKWNIRFVGPNCISILNLDNGLALPFVPLAPAMTKKGSVSVVAQSGGVALTCMRLFSFEGIGFSKLISMGNKLDLNENDYLEFLISDPSTETVVLYLENIADGRRLLQLAASTSKPIIVLKSNTSPSSRQIARFHTAALAGDDQVAEAAMKQAGIHRVPNIQELLETVKVFSLPLMKGNRLGILCRSGGEAVLQADAAHRYGFELARFSNAFFDMIRKEVRAGVISMTNPLDMGDIFDIDFYMRILERALMEVEVDGVVMATADIADTEIEPTKRLIRASHELARKYDKPVVFCTIPAKTEWFSVREISDMPVFSESDLAVKALARSREHHRRQLRKRTKGGGSVVPAVRVSRARAGASGGVYDLLKRYGLPVAQYATAGNIRECLDAAQQIGYPVVLKISDPEIIHKTEAGGVKLNIRSSRDLRKAFREMEDGFPGKDRVFLVQKMAPAGTEVIIGGRQDNEFGAVVLFGLGGIFVEVLKDVSLRVAPIGRREAREMIEEIRGAALLKGFRGSPPADLNALGDCLVRISRLMVENSWIRNLDINPLIVYEMRKGCVVVDAKMEKE